MIIIYTILSNYIEGNLRHTLKSKPMFNIMYILRPEFWMKSVGFYNDGNIQVKNCMNQKCLLLRKFI